MRIVSLSPSITEILFAIGKGSDIIANTYYCDYPDEAKKIEKAGSWTDIKWDKVKDLKPDIIFTSTVVQEKMAKEYSEKGFNIQHFDPRSLEHIYNDILKIGSLVDAVDASKELVLKMKKKENSLRAKNNKVQKKIYIEEWYEPPMVSGNWVPDIVEIAGGIYKWVKKEEISREVRTQEVQNYNPDVIFVAYCGFGKKSDVNRILNRAGWENIKAVKEKRIYAIDEGILNRPGPRVLDIAEEMNHLINQV